MQKLQDGEFPRPSESHKPLPIDVQGQSKSRERKKEDEKDIMERPPFCEIIFEEKHRVVIDDLECVQKLKTLFRLGYNVLLCNLFRLKQLFGNPE